MGHQFVKINYRNFEDALSIADARGDRFRIDDISKAITYFDKNNVDFAVLQRKAMSAPKSAIAVITVGLMQGTYIYWPEIDEAWIYDNSEKDIVPLTCYGEEMAYDVVLSYTFESIESDNVKLLVDNLKKQGLRVFLILYGENLKDPIWNVRFREAVFYSYYFIPILNEAYLKNEGTIRELFDFSRMTVQHRSTEFFYPLIPLVESSHILENESMGMKSKDVSKYDFQEFEWIRTHLYSFDITWGIENISSIITSFIRNYQGVKDFSFLDMFSRHLALFEFLVHNGRRSVGLYVPHPFMDTYYKYVIYDHGCRYLGLSEKSGDADVLPDRLSASQVVGNYIRELSDEYLPKYRVPKDLDTDSNSRKMESDIRFCTRCHYVGEPLVRVVPANPAVGIHEDGCIHVCPKCNGAMIVKE